MNQSDILYIPLLLLACFAAGFIIHVVRRSGWRAAAGWLAVLIGMAMGGFHLITSFSAPWNKVLQTVAGLLPVCVLMIPLLGMLMLAWLTGAQLASGLLMLTKRLTK